MKIKREIVICGAIFLLMASLPFMAIGLPNKSEKSPESVKTSAKASKPEGSTTEKISSATSSTYESNVQQSFTNEVSEKPAPAEASSEVSDNARIYADGTFKILDTSSGEILTLSDEEFLIGAVAAEMPTSYETEALKAQCVAAYTCYAKKRADERDNPHEELKGADFSADLSKKMIYLTPDRMKDACGDSYDDIYNKIKSIAESVKGEVLTYKGEIITCTYFAISSGTTDSFEDVFGSELPYLTPVSSPYDTLAPNYKSQKTVTAEEFKEAISNISKGTDFSNDEEKWLGKVEQTDSETVKTITICGTKLKGSEIREAFGLRSACFEIKYKDGKFTFTVKGYGHNVGMSQYGANEMAKQGATYEEILHHYYSID